jgi:hypothetical protein
MHTLHRTLLKTLSLAALPGALAFAKPSTPAALGAPPAMPPSGLSADAVDPTP